MRIIIIGNGIAGIAVAQELSTVLPKENTHIQIYAKEPHPSYTRLRLPELVYGKAEPKDLILYKEAWYADHAVSVRLSCPVVGIDRENHRVRLVDGSQDSYDALVIATGAVPNLLDCPGSHAEGILPLRNLEDALTLQAALRQYPQGAVVIGGGLLGLEAANAVMRSGVDQVWVLERAGQLLPRQLDDTAAALLEAHLGSLGLHVVTNAVVESVAVDAKGRASRVVLADGRSFAGQTVLFSLGVHPEIQLARQAGLQVGRGIVVDRDLRTSDPAIFAIGDCAEFEGIVWGIVPAALEQAHCAALCIAGKANGSYCQTIPSTVLKITGLDVASFGKFQLTAQECSSGIFTRLANSCADGSRYESYVMREGVLVGAILYGSKVHLGQVRKLMGTAVCEDLVHTLLLF
ncbi:MAG: NAD(P)/FAD-dependent oxidoreductase [Sphaerochaetaceae bacterium]